jgi:hypothetical protein
MNNKKYYYYIMEKIKEAINKIFQYDSQNYIFVYTPPKVGSTTLVTSLRISLGKLFNIIHIHDDIMLSVLTSINNVTINDIIYFLASEGKNIYVIDIYRTPIERKMSEFFEKISPYHFNNTEDNISNYNLKRITNRFNKLFPYLAKGEHYFDKYNIYEPTVFNFETKYSLQEINNIKYIKLRLCDTDLWAGILSKILNNDIVLVNDYLTETKQIGELYKNFKNEYKLPINFLDLIESCKYLKFYYSDEERKKYLDEWRLKPDDYFTPYTEEEYNFYVILYLENQHINDIQQYHYIDEGCYCDLCKKKRREYFFKAKRGEKISEKIMHNKLFNENVQQKNIKIYEIIKNRVAELNKHKIKAAKKPSKFALNISYK